MTYFDYQTSWIENYQQVIKNDIQNEIRKNLKVINKPIDTLSLKVVNIETAQELINVLKLAVKDGDLRLSSLVDITAYSKDGRIEITFH